MPAFTQLDYHHLHIGCDEAASSVTGADQLSVATQVLDVTGSLVLGDYFVARWLLRASLSLAQRKEMASLNRKSIHRFAVSVTTLMALSSFETASAQELAATEIELLYRKASAHVFVVRSEQDGRVVQGSAVVYKSVPAVAVEGKTYPTYSILVTNAHVVGDSKQVTLSKDGRQFVANVGFADRNLDMAHLQVNGVTLPAAQVAQRKPRVGESVYAIGAPRGLESSLSVGIISGLRESNGVQLVQTTAAISPGSSGGGLFNSAGQLVGITTLRIADSEALNFAVSAEHVQELDEALVASSMVYGYAVAQGTSEEVLAQLESNEFMQWLRAARYGEYRLTAELIRLREKMQAAEVLSDSHREAFTMLSQMSDWAIRSYKSTNQARAAIPPAPTHDSRADAKQKLILRCSVLLASGGQPEELTVRVDLESRTANGFRAQISGEKIWWQPSADLELSIDRYVGAIEMIVARDLPHRRRGERIGRGPCKAEEIRKF